jgi:hypothetical protein
MATADKSYSYLSDYIDGTKSTIVVNGKSILTWYGGDMPPGGASGDSQGEADFEAWVAAGAQNN